MTEELLEVLWTLEHTLEREPQATALLNKVLAGELIAASELPQPSPLERQAPGNEALDESTQPALPETAD